LLKLSLFIYLPPGRPKDNVLTKNVRGQGQQQSAAIISTRVFSDFCPSKVVTKVSSMRSEPSLQCLFSVLTMDILFCFVSSESLSPLMVILTAKVTYSSFDKHALVGVHISAAAI